MKFLILVICISLITGCIVINDPSYTVRTNSILLKTDKNIMGGLLGPEYG